MNLIFWQRRLPVVGVAVAMFVLAAISIMSVQSIDEFQRRSQTVEHTHQIISKIEQIMSQVRDIESGGRGFIIAARPEFLQAVDVSRHAVPAEIARLDQMVHDPEQKRNVGILSRLVAERLSVLDLAIRLRQQSGDIQATMAELANGSGLQAMERIRIHVVAMQAIERTLLDARGADAIQSARVTKQMILFGTIVAYLLIGAAVWRLTREVRHRRQAEKLVATANRALLLNTRNLELANKELESFSYSISHDLRIPLRAISGYSKIIIEDYGDKLDAEAHRLLQVIRSNGKRMGQLIDDLLRFSKLGRQQIVASHVDFNDLIESVIVELRRKDMPVAVDIDVARLPLAWGDRTLLYQVWINLLSNAFKYSQKHAQPAVRISARTQDGEVIYCISDNGVGFDMEHARKLFGVFERLHAEDEFPGTGVGLAIVHRIITRHGGRIWADARPGEGARFCFTLSLKD